jgi:hypothetical protein
VPFQSFVNVISILGARRVVLHAPAAHQEIRRGLDAEAKDARAERDGRRGRLVRVAENDSPFVLRAAAGFAGEGGGAHAITRSAARAPARSPCATSLRASASASRRTVFATDRFSRRASSRMSGSSSSRRNWTETVFPNPARRFLFFVVAMLRNIGPRARKCKGNLKLYSP